MIYLHCFPCTFVILVRLYVVLCLYQFFMIFIASTRQIFLISASCFCYICTSYHFCIYTLSAFFFLHKKCTEGHLPCTNGIVLIQKAGMKRCGQRAALADRREPLAPTGLPSQPSDHTFSPSLAFLQWQHDLRHKHPRLILPVNVPAIFFNHKIDPF